MKLCIIYNFAQHYRKEIFQLLDKEYDCDWYFGDTMADVKKLDYSLLRGRVHEIHNGNLGRIKWQTGILNLVRKYDVFLMIGESWNISIWLFCFYAKLLKNKRLYFWEHGWYGKETKIESTLKHCLNSTATGFFLYGEYAKKLMINEGFPEEKLHVIYNSLDYSRQLAVRKNLKVTDIFNKHFNNNFPNLFFVGRLTSVKRLEMILYAMKNEKDKGVLFNMTFIGDGVMMSELSSLAEQLGLKNNVWFYGPCYDENELGHLIYNADICVAPGNIGLTAMHTMVFGTPAITHNCFKWQMPEFEAIKEGVTGTFFEIGNVDSLGENLEKWFRTKGKERDLVRQDCMREIDSKWNPQYQIRIFKKYIQ